MKNKVFVFATIAVIVCSAAFFAGCGTAPVATSAGVDFSNQGGFGQQILTPMKDFESMGLVFAQVEFQVDSRGEISGETFTFQQLLREAQRLGADAIINITIDRRLQNVRVGNQTNQQETWFGSALAIKYTDVIRIEGNENIIINDGRYFGTAGGASVSNAAEIQEAQERRRGLAGLFGR